MAKTETSTPSESEQMRDIATAALEDSKGLDIKILDVRSLTDVTDFMIIATGTSDRHVKSLSQNVLDMMREAGWKHIGVEGEEIRDWILVDFVDVVVHVMKKQSRDLYDLEGLWDETLSKLLEPQRSES